MYYEYLSTFLYLFWPMNDKNWNIFFLVSLMCLSDLYVVNRLKQVGVYIYLDYHDNGTVHVWEEIGPNTVFWCIASLK